MQSSILKSSEGVLHFLSKGEGPPIFLFHASPMSSSSLAPLIDQLSENFTVIAPDTPGYGYSSPLTSRPDHIREYVAALHELQHHLECSKIAIYGTATGAQIGIRYALEYPDDVAQLFLDNTAHFTEEEKEKILESYFPDYTPKEDGAHLAIIWDTVTNLFKYFPWCFKDEAHKLSTPVPPLLVLHKVFIDYLLSGAKYDWAYKTAFAHENREHIFEVKVPVHIFRWEGSILTTYMDRIFEVEQPQTLSSEKIPVTQDRYASMASSIQKRYTGESKVLDLSRMGFSSFQTNSKASLPIFIPSFPKIEESGAYLLDGWLALDDFMDKDGTIADKTALFIEWAKRAK